MLPIEDNANLVRVGHAVVNIDVAEYNAYIQKKKAAEAERAEMDRIKASINNLNNQVNAMSDTLNQILNLLKK